MEILGGSARGTVLDVPAGMDVRPTSVRARRALFDSLGDLSGKRVCDLFAGSGALGLEAVSRGASGLVSVESSAKTAAVIRSNMKRVAERTGLSREGTGADLRLIQGTLPACMRMVAASGKADIIFADPPYADSTNAAGLLLKDKDFLAWSEESLLIWELPESRALIQKLPQGREIADIRKFGPIRFMFIRKPL